MLNMLIKTIPKTDELSRRDAANRVSINVVMFAPRIYGMTFSRRI